MNEDKFTSRDVMNIVGKHILIKSEFIGWNKDKYKYNTLRRINRETPSQFVSDVQRFSYYRTKPAEYELFKKISRRFKKKELEQSLESEDENIYIIEPDSTIEPMKCSVPFERLFFICNGDMMQKFMERAEREHKNEFTHPVCLFDNEHIGKHWGESNEKIANHLREITGIETIYMADSLSSKINKNNWHYTKLESDEHGREMIFYQITHHGDDKSIIYDDEDQYNEPIGFWVFDDCVVYKRMSGYSEW